MTPRTAEKIDPSLGSASEPSGGAGQQAFGEKKNGPGRAFESGLEGVEVGPRKRPNPLLGLWLRGSALEKGARVRRPFNFLSIRFFRAERTPGVEVRATF